jgi:hypothetical protein
LKDEQATAVLATSGIHPREAPTEIWPPSVEHHAVASKHSSIIAVDPSADNPATQAAAENGPNTFDVNRQGQENRDNLESLRGSHNLAEPSSSPEPSILARSPRCGQHADSAIGEGCRTGGPQTTASAAPDFITKIISASESRIRFINTIEVVSALDSSFMELLHRHLQGDEKASIDIIRQNFRELQEARVSLRKEQEDCQRRDQYLIRTEPTALEGHTGVSLENHSSQAESWREEDDPTEEIHPMADSETSFRIAKVDLPLERKRYLSQVGDVDLLRESLKNMEVEYSRVMQDKAMLDIIGQSLHRPDSIFLKTFDTQYESLALLLQEAEAKELELKHAQSGADVRFPNRNPVPTPAVSDVPPSYTHSLFGRYHYFDDNYGPAFANDGLESTTAAQEFLVPHGTRPSVYENVTGGLDGESVDKSSYVNAWLLHRAQTIPSEFARLLDLQIQAGVQPRPGEYTQLVLTLWPTTNIMQAHHARQHDDKSHETSTAPNDGHAQVSKPASDSRSLAEGTKQHMEPRLGARPSYSTR